MTTTVSPVVDLSFTLRSEFLRFGRGLKSEFLIFREGSLVSPFKNWQKWILHEVLVLEIHRSWGFVIDKLLLRFIAGAGTDTLF